MESPYAESPSNEQLALQAQQGCMASFEELLRRLQSRLLNFLQHVGPKADVEDVLQETFLRAYSRLHHYRTTWKFSTWLFTLARRASINYHRRQHPVADNGSIQLAVSTVAEPDEAAATAERRTFLWATAERVLNADERTALWLHYVEDIPVGEIAAAMERSTVAVKTMMFRARKKLLPLVGGHEPEACRARLTRPVEVSRG
jgi:RNA polymerase sigma-70 factor (ECF subfamily)